MSILPAADSSPPGPPAPRFDLENAGVGPQGHPWLAWLMIALAVAMLVASHLKRGKAEEEAPADSAFASKIFELQCKYLVGGADLAPEAPAEFRDLLRVLNTGPVSQRLRLAVVYGELAGAPAALKLLRELETAFRDQAPAPPESQRATRQTLERLYRDYAAEKWAGPSVAEADRRALRTELGWFGDLALHPRDGADRAGRTALLKPAQRIVFLLLGAVAFAIIVGFLGVVGLIALAVGYISGTLRGGLRPGMGVHGVYAETFAVWLLLFMGFSLAAGLMPVPRFRLLATAAAMLLSLLALVWPVFRGIPWSSVRRDIGWTGGRAGIVEPIVGIGSYGLAVPLAAAGMLITLVILALRAKLHGGALESQSLPGHPIVELVVHGGWWMRVQILLLASVVAPIVEETMFRGVLYRHLRDATRWQGPFLSGLVSAVVVSFVFAAIHPQGLLGIPPLMGIAFALTLVREWRESLIASMVAHGINNGIVLGLLLLAMS